MKQGNVHHYFVYMMTNRWRTTLYTGVSNSLITRVWQHKNPASDGFTKKYNCTSLVYYEIYERIGQAIAREKQIKSWTRAKKEALIATLNPEWKDLAAEWCDQRSSEGDPSPSSRLRMTAISAMKPQPVIPSREDGEESPSTKEGTTNHD